MDVDDYRAAQRRQEGDSAQRPTMTLGQLRAMTKDLPDETYLTVYVPSTGWWVNLGLDEGTVAAQANEDREQSLVLDAFEDFDTRQW